MIKEMSKIQIIGSKAVLDECIRLLHALSVVHIETLPVEARFDDRFFRAHPIEKEKIREKRYLEETLERLKNLTFLLKTPPALERVTIQEGRMVSLIETIRSVEKKVRELHARREALTEEFNSLERYEKILRAFAPVVSRLGGLKNFVIIGLTIERSRRDVIRVLEGEVARITQGMYRLHVRELDEKTLGIVLTYQRRFDPEMRSLISSEAISEIKLPEEYEDMPLLVALERMARRREELKGLISSIERELEDISRRWYGVIVALRKAVEDKIDEIGVLSYCAETRFAFVIEGWIPKEMMEVVKEKFSRLFSSSVLVREIEIKEEEVDLIPVYIKNPRILKPFEVFLKALPTPRYGSVDPTPYIALFFPIFFGLIVGDAGYGLVLFLLGIYIKHRFRYNEFIYDLASVLSVCGVTSIIGGVLFGEFFGDLGERAGIVHPILFDRMKALKTFLALSIGIGIGHVLLGILIAVVNYINRGKVKEAGAKLSYFILITSFLLILGIYFEYLPRGLLSPGIIVLVVSFIFFVIVEGVLGPIEFIKALGNILSYVRIMAVGTASVVMAVVANRIGGLTGSLLVGILVAGLIHALNIILSLVSPTIQSMRLQYVEFLSKFYEGGGRRYEPFKKR